MMVLNFFLRLSRNLGERDKPTRERKENLPQSIKLTEQGPVCGSFNISSLYHLVNMSLYRGRRQVVNEMKNY